jgi:hypothetical protein
MRKAAEDFSCHFFAFQNNEIIIGFDGSALPP